MNYLIPLFSLRYWFDSTPIPFLPIIDKIILFVLFGFIIGGIGCLVYRKMAKGLEKYLKKLLRRYANLLITMGAVGLMLYAFTWQRVPFLSMRFFFLLWAILLAYWFWIILRFQLKELPIQKKKRHEQMERDRWLPKKKRK